MLTRLADPGDSRYVLQRDVNYNVVALISVQADSDNIPYVVEHYEYKPYG